MKRILALDYGLVRTGVAVTDLLQMIASPLDTVDTKKLKEFLHHYLQKEPVETIVLGMPKELNNTASDLTTDIQNLAAYLKKTYPFLDLVFVDERFTSKIASKTIAVSGLPSHKRKEKALIDKVSAAIILQSYLEQR